MTKSTVTLLDHMGSDLMVVNAARVSHHKESFWTCCEFNDGTYCCTGECFGGDFDGPQLSERDTKLIHYLAEHNHWTPFAHPQVSVRVKAPLFVRSQLFKHKQGLVENEVSRRYVDEDPEFYVPKTWRKRAAEVKQGSSDEPVGDWMIDFDYRNVFIERATTFYRHLLDAGVCPEQARMVLPQSMMTEWVWTGSLAAFSRVCKLRLDTHTQYETRDVASALSDIIAPLFPVSWKALLG